MANRYWVGGSGTWNTSNTKWSATSGGASGATVPTTADDVFFDANSSTSGDLVVTFTTTNVNAASITIAKPSGGNISWTGGSTSNNITVANNLVVTATSSEFTTNSNINLNFTGADKNVYIQSNGANFATHNIILNGANGNFTLNSAIASNTFTFANGNLLLNGYDFYCNIANVTSGTPKSWSWGSNSIYIAGSNTTILTYNNPASTTYTGTPSFVLTYAGAVGTRTLSLIGGTQGTIEVIRVGFTGNATDEIRFTAATTLQDFNLSNFAGTMNANVTMSVYGNLTLNPAVTYTSGTGLILALRGNSSWTPTQSINGNDTTLLANLMANGTSNYSLAGNLTLLSNRTANLATGNLILNGYTLSTGLFNSNNSGVRGINANVANSKIIVTALTGAVLDIASVANLTVTGNFEVVHDRPSSVAGEMANYYFGNTGVESGMPTLKLISGSGNANIISAYLRDLDFTGFTGALNTGTRVVHGNLTFSSGMSIVSGGTTTIAGNNDSWVTTNGLNLDGVFGVNKANTSAKVTLVDDLTNGYGNLANRGIQLLSGTLDTNSKNVTSGYLLANGTTTRGIVFGSGSFLLNSISGNIIDMRVSTNMSLSGNANFTVSSNGASTVNLYLGNTWSQNNAPNIILDNLYIAANSSTQYLIIGNIGTIDFTNFVGTLASNSAMTYYGSTWNTPSRGNLTMPSNGTATFTFSGDAEQTVTTNGKNFPAATMIIDKSGGNFILGSSLLVRSNAAGSAGNTQLNNGNIILNNYVLNTRSFTSNTSSPRTIDWGVSGTIDIWANTSNALGNVTLWSTEGANLITKGSRSVGIKANAGTSNTITVTTSPNVTQDNAINFYANTGTITDQALLRFGNTSNTDGFGTININRSGQSGYDKIRHANILLYGNLIINSTDYAPDPFTTLTFVGNNNQTLTARPISAFSYIVDKSDGNLTHTGQFITNSTGQVEIWRGNWISNSTLSLNKFAVYGNTGPASVTLSSGVISVQTLSAAQRGNMYFANTANVTIIGSNIPGNPYLSLSGMSDLYTGDKQIPYLIFTGDWGNPQGNTAIYGNLICDRAAFYAGGYSYDYVYQFESGKTYSFGNILFDKLQSTGIVIQSTTSGSQHYLVYTGSGNVNVSDITISDSNASPANTWYALTSNNNVDGGNNYGWIFSGGPVPAITYYQMLGMFR